MTNSNKLFRWRSPYDLKGTEGLFAAAMAENARFQAQHCPDYTRILREQGVTDLTDPLSLPPLPTLYFKRHALFSLPESRLLIKATSSGTSGSMSRMAFDAGSLLRGLAMVWRMTRYHHLLSPVPCHYLILGYQPHRGNDTAFSKTGYGFTFFAPALSRTYALVWREGSYQLDLEGLRRRLLRCAGGPFPIRTIGFPAYTWLLLSQMEKEGIRLACSLGHLELDFLSLPDLYTLLGNAIDNAVEGVRNLPDPEKRVVQLSIQTSGGFVSIQTNNYYAGELTLENGLPRTTKRDPAGHGYGLKSIRYLARKYGGSMSVSARDGVFVLQIMLPVQS